MKQTLGRHVGEVREHECNMHVCVGIGSHWLKLLQTILFFFNMRVKQLQTFNCSSTSAACVK